MIRVLNVAVVVTVMFWTSAAWARPDERLARAAFARGTALYDAARYTDACANSSRPLN